MYQQCFVIYDIVYFNGQVLTDMPLKKRISTLREVVPHEIPGIIIIILQMFSVAILQFELAKRN